MNITKGLQDETIDAVDKVIDCIIEFEMEGKLDKDDPFYPTVMCLKDFREKLLVGKAEKLAGNKEEYHGDL